MCGSRTARRRRIEADSRALRHAVGTGHGAPARKAPRRANRRGWAARGQVSRPGQDSIARYGVLMAKTLVIAEKPSVGRDLAGALDGHFQRRKLEDIRPSRKKKKDEETPEEVVEAAKSPRSRTREDTHFLESDDYVITWAVGHLVQLAEPEEYDEKWKKWRMADLPVPPNGFKLVPRDAKAKKQLKLIEALLKREDVDRIINACDAGREGELIFAYVYESVFGASATNENPPKPVERLWISSMTKQAIREGFAKLRPGPQMQSLELAARSRSEADWLVGMNATRAATIRGRAWVGGVVSLGRVQTPTLAMIVKREREIQAFVPEPYRLIHGTFQPPYQGLWFEGDETRIFGDLERADRIVAKVSGQDGTVEKVERKEQSERAPPLRLLRAPHPAGRAVPVRRKEGDHVSADVLALPVGRHGPAAEAYGRDPAADRRLPRGRRVRARARPASAAARRQRREGRRPPRDHPDRHRSRRQRADARRAPCLRSHRAPLPRCLPSAGAVCAHDGDHDRRGGALPHARQDHARGRLACRLRPRGRPRAAVGGRGEGGRGDPRAHGRSDGALHRRRDRGQDDEAAAALHRGDAALRNGDGRQAHRRRGAARGDEGLRPRNAGDPRRDDRDADPARVHRARRQGPPGDTEGYSGHHDARGAQAHVPGAHRRLGAQALGHRARPRRP